MPFLPCIKSCVTNCQKVMDQTNSETQIAAKLLVNIYTVMDEIQCRGRGGLPFRIVVEVLEPKAWLHMKAWQNS